MTSNLFSFKNLLAVFLLFLLMAHLYGQQTRAMTLEDLLNFKSMGNTFLSDDGRWMAYEIKMERNDGYGMIVATNKSAEFKIERGEKPVFSSDSRWAVYTQVPPIAESENKPASEKPGSHAVLVNLQNGNQTVFEEIRSVRFSNNSKYLIIHHRVKNDSLLTKSQNDKLKKAGTELKLVKLADLRTESIPFVEAWTIDSLSKNLVYVLKDTLKDNNGLYFRHVSAPDFSANVIDTTGHYQFGSFAWYEKRSVLAYMKAADEEKPKTESAELYLLDVGMELPQLLVTQNEAPDGQYLPFDNTLTWSNDGKRLFFGFRLKQFSSVVSEKSDFAGVIDSLRSLAAVDIWHVNDPRIKTNEKASWNQRRRQNLLAVIHMDDNRIIPLANEEIPMVQPGSNPRFLAGYSSEPYAVRATWDGNYRDFYGIEITTGRKTLIAKELSDMASISPTGQFALYFDKGNWHSYNLISGSLRYLSHNADVPFYNENHDIPGDPSSYRMMGWLDDGVSVLLYDKYDIWLANLEMGELTCLTNGEGRENKIIFRIRKLDDKPLFSAKDDLFLEGFYEKTKERALYSVGFKSKSVSLLKDENRNLKWLHASKDLKTLTYTRESYDEYPDIWSVDSRFRNPLRLTNLSRQLEEFLWGSSELVEFENTDGVPLQGVLIKPGNYDNTKKYPVFVYYYEKSSQRLHDFNQTVINHRPSFGYYASNGYCVFLPDIHFEVGYPGMSAVKSLVPGVQKLIDMGVADENAIGLHGHSWSGYQTAFVVTQTDIFKAAIAGAPVSNMTSAYSGIRWGTGLARQFQYERGQSRIGPSMFENQELYLENSPVFYADKIKTPLLLMHGDKDEAVPWEQSIEMYLAMRRLGKDVIFLQYRDEPHHPQKYPNKIDYTIRMKEYFDYQLKGMEPARWIKEGSPYLGK
jgi:dipeptidyl aminopeptidase/acylaminoacyl peptidase